MTHDDSDHFPLTAREGATSDGILICAAELVLRQGIQALSLGDVHRVPSVSGWQLSRSSADKDELIRALTVRQTGGVA